MIKISLWKKGAISVSRNTSPGEFAASEHATPPDNTVGAVFNGKLIPLDEEMKCDGWLEFVSDDDIIGREILRFETAQVAANAVKTLYDNTSILLVNLTPYGFMLAIAGHEIIQDTELETIEIEMSKQIQPDFKPSLVRYGKYDPEYFEQLLGKEVYKLIFTNYRLSESRCRMDGKAVDISVLYERQFLPFDKSGHFKLNGVRHYDVRKEFKVPIWTLWGSASLYATNVTENLGNLDELTVYINRLIEAPEYDLSLLKEFINYIDHNKGKFWSNEMIPLVGYLASAPEYLLAESSSWGVSLEAEVLNSRFKSIGVHAKSLLPKVR